MSNNYNYKKPAFVDTCYTCKYWGADIPGETAEIINEKNGEVQKVPAYRVTYCGLHNKDTKLNDYCNNYERDFGLFKKLKLTFGEGYYSLLEYLKTEEITDDYINDFVEDSIEETDEWVWVDE